MAAVNFRRICEREKVGAVFAAGSAADSPVLVVCLLCDGTVPPTGPHTSARARQDLFFYSRQHASLPAEMVEKRKRDGKEKRQCQRLRRKEREEAEKNDDALIQAAIDENASRASGADA